MPAVRKDYFLDHDHSGYVGQWDWERAITSEQRNLELLKSIVRKIWKVLVGAEKFAQEMFRELRTPRYPNLPEELTFLHAEELLAMYPDLPRKRHETVILRKYPAIFIIGIGWPLKDGSPHEMVPPTKTTGSSIPANKPCATRTVSTATFWSGTTSLSAATNSLRWAFASTPKPSASSSRSRICSIISGSPIIKPLPIMKFQCDRRRHRAIPDADATSAQSPPRRSKRHRVAERVEGNVCEEEYLLCWNKIVLFGRG